MAGRLKLEITETTKYLGNSLKQVKSESEKKRLHMLVVAQNGTGKG
jgi:hypothetical protein